MTAPHSPSPPSRPDGTTPDAPSEAPKDDSTRLSLTQVIASALAAVSATVLMSFFGVAGTIIGAGLASVATVIGNFLYTRSIEKAQAQLKPVVANIKPVVRPRTSYASAGAASTSYDGRTTTSRLEQTDADATGEGLASDAMSPGDATPPGDDSPQGADDAAPKPRNRWLRLIDKHGKAKVLTVTTLGLFVVVMGLVLAVELAIGKPISDAVRGQEGSGTSISTVRDRGSDADGSTGTSDDTDQQDSGGDRSGGNGQDQQEQDSEQEAPADDPANVPGTDPTAPPTGGSGSTDGSTDTDTEGSGGTDGTDEDSGDTGDTDTGTDTEGGTSTGSGTDGAGTSGGTGAGESSSGQSSSGQSSSGQSGSGQSGSGTAGGTVEEAPAS